MKECASRIRVLQVNRKTLSLFAATDLDHLVGNLDRVFRDDMLLTHIEELVQLWEGKTEFSSNTVNYSLAGDRLDIQLKATILPGYEDSWARVLLAIEDVTDREDARRLLVGSENFARGLFEHSPVSLWVRGFLRGQAADRRGAGAGHHRPACLHRRARGIRAPLHQ